MRSAIYGRAMHPRIVVTERSIVPSEINGTVCAAGTFSRAAISLIAAGTYTDPAHNPMIDTRTYTAFNNVRCRYSLENKIFKGWPTDQFFICSALLRHRAESVTP